MAGGWLWMTRTSKMFPLQRAYIKYRCHNLTSLLSHKLPKFIEINWVWFFSFGGKHSLWNDDNCTNKSRGVCAHFLHFCFAAVLLISLIINYFLLFAKFRVILFLFLLREMKIFFEVKTICFIRILINI